jgi:hypothetical protein
MRGRLTIAASLGASLASLGRLVGFVTMLGEIDKVILQEAMRVKLIERSEGEIPWLMRER